MSNFRLPSAVLLSSTLHLVVLAWLATSATLGKFDGNAMPQQAGPLLLSLRLAGKSGLPMPAETIKQDSRVSSVRETATKPENDQPSEAGPVTGDPAVVLQDSAFYYPAKMLSRMPEAVTNFAPTLPPDLQFPPDGQLTLRLWISESGKLDKVSVVSDGLPGNYSETALAAFSAMRFTPGEINGVTVRTWADIVIEYKDLRPAEPSPPNTELVPVSLPGSVLGTGKIPVPSTQP